MSSHNDYSETRACLLRLMGALDEARLVAGRANLPPALGPQAVRQQIDAVDDLLAAAQADLAAARQSVSLAGRQGLSLVE